MSLFTVADEVTTKPEVEEVMPRVANPLPKLTTQLGALPYVPEKVIVHDVTVPVPTIICPVLSLPVIVGVPPQDDTPTPGPPGKRTMPVGAPLAGGINS